jgi:hypothetical protein
MINWAGRLTLLLLFLSIACVADTAEVSRDGLEFVYDTGTYLCSRPYKAQGYPTESLPGPELYQTPAFLYQGPKESIFRDFSVCWTFI